jgi:hypothetical protein
MISYIDLTSVPQDRTIVTGAVEVHAGIHQIPTYFPVGIVFTHLRNSPDSHLLPSGHCVYTPQEFPRFPLISQWALCLHTSGIPQIPTYFPVGIVFTHLRNSPDSHLLPSGHCVYTPQEFPRFPLISQWALCLHTSGIPQIPTYYPVGIVFTHLLIPRMHIKVV